MYVATFRPWLKGMVRNHCALLILTLSKATMGAQVVAADVPTFPEGTPTVKVPYTHTEDFRHLNSLHVRLSFNGGEARGFEVDTGSVGIMVGADMIPGFDGRGEKGEITYSSSGVHLTGVWTTVDVGFPDAASSDGKPVVAHMQVLAVTGKDCTGKGVNAVNCTPGEAHPFMLGVGFGRGDEKAFGAQQHNAFVMLNAMQKGQMRRGYTITPAGIQLGLNASTLGTGWVWQKLSSRLKPDAIPSTYNGPPDYTTAPGTFAYKGQKMPMGTVLMDTGLTNLMIESPGLPKEGDAPNGTPIDVFLLSGKLKYSFLVNDPTNPATPRKASWRDAVHGTYVNTGLHALSLFDYCYDADGGYLGLRPRP